MLALFRKTVSKNKKKLFVYVLIAALFTWMFVAFFPSVNKDAEKLQEAFSAYPEEFLKAFNVDMSNLFTSLEAFMKVENFSILWPIIAIILVISLAGGALAGEVEDGTIELLLAQPVSRTKIYFAKYFGGLIILLLFTLVSIFSVVPFALLHNVEFSFMSYVFVSIVGFLFVFAIYSLTFMFSSFFSSKGKASSVAGGLVLVMYALNIVSSLQESANDLKYLSFFYYYDFNSALMEQTVGLSSVLVFFIIGVFSTLIGLFAFRRRDQAA